MKSPKFERHYNRSMGKYYHTERDLRSDMKANGLEFKTGDAKSPTPNPYVKSEWAKEMLNDVKNRKGRPPGDRFVKELEKRGYTQKRADEARKLAREM